MAIWLSDHAGRTHQVIEGAELVRMNTFTGWIGGQRLRVVSIGPRRVILEHLDGPRRGDREYVARDTLNHNESYRIRPT